MSPFEYIDSTKLVVVVNILIFAAGVFLGLAL